MASSHGRSKKQSAGSRRRQPSLPEDFVLYLDENLHNCKPILDALTKHGVKHERHGQHFSAGTEELEKTAVLQYRVREFYFSSGNYSGAEMAETLVAALPGMAKIYRKHDPPFIASITKSGNVNLRFPS